MKKSGILLLCLVALQNYAFSQGPLKSFLQNSNLMAGPTWSNWSSVPAPVKLRPAHNIGFDVMAMQRFGKGKVGLNTGLGLSMVNIHSNVFPWQFDKQGNVDSIGLIDMDQVKDGKKFIRKNKLALTYLEVPLELSFRSRSADTDSSNGKTGFKIAIGFRMGVCIDAHMKQKTTDYIWKMKDFDNITRFRYGPTVRIGYGMASLYARYDLNSTFSAEKAPDYTLYTVGIMLSAF